MLVEMIQRGQGCVDCARRALQHRLQLGAVVAGNEVAAVRIPSGSCPSRSAAASQPRNPRTREPYAREGYRTTRTELGGTLAPPIVEEVLAAYRSEGQRLVAISRAVDLIAWALASRRGDVRTADPLQLTL
jgi:hypothetical protein